VACNIKLPPKTSSKDITVEITGTKLKVCLKANKNEPLLEGKWAKKINGSESLWSLEKDGDSSLLVITLEKIETKNWWKSLLEGDIEIDTQSVEPENSKLSDLDGDTRTTVEKMMFDQQQK
jgi:hypothetical protein